jgi:hypothetical protein
MGWLTAAIVVGYLIGLRLVARRYFLRRHGVTIQGGDQGALFAAMVGLFWPVTLLLAATREPAFCDHGRHVLARGRIMEEIRQIEEIRRREGEGSSY